MTRTTQSNESISPTVDFIFTQKYEKIVSKKTLHLCVHIYNKKYI